MFVIKFELLYFIGLLAILLPIEAAICAPQENDEFVRRVRDAWKSRREAIKTFHYECELKESVTKPATPGASELFGDAPVGTPTIDVELLSTIAFSYDNGKRAFKKDGQQWDEQRAVPKEYMFRATFDGDYKSLVQSRWMPLGSIDRRRPPEYDLIAFSHVTAFWLAFNPEAYLKVRAYDANKMQVDKQRVVRDGREFVVLHIPRSNPQWEGVLHVDPRRAYVPTQFKEVHNGVEVASLKIQYVPNEKVGWAISGWLQQRLYPSGRPSSSAKAKVKRCAVNSDLDDAIFALSFPPGCHITDVSIQGRKSFVQLKDGSLKEISESDYGRVGVE